MRVFVFLLFSFLTFTSLAQEDPRLNPRDLANEMLRLVSAGNDDWEAFRDLFVPTAHFTVISDYEAEGMQAKSFALEDFVRLFKNSPERTFTERSLKMDIDQYNGIAHVWQTYEVEVNGGTNQGINSIQMIFHHQQWWISNVNWANNTNGVPIPERYLPE